MDNQNLDKNANLDNITLALLFSADEPLSVRRIAAILEDVEAVDIKRSIDGWRKRFDDEAWSITIEHVAGGYQMATRSDYGLFVGRLYSKRRKLRLSRAGLETLAIIAYKQPVTRADIEIIRGVGCGGVITNLMERSLIKITGKAKVLGAPFLYGTTPEFLEYLGLNSLRDLPSMEELEALLEREAYPESAVDDEVAAVASLDDAGEDEDDEGLGAVVEEAMEALGPEELEPTAAGAVAGAARVGPMIEEPLNRPVDAEDNPDGESDDADAAAESPVTQQATIDEREDER